MRHVASRKGISVPSSDEVSETNGARYSCSRDRAETRQNAVADRARCEGPISPTHDDDLVSAEAATSSKAAARLGMDQEAASHSKLFARSARTRPSLSVAPLN
eukprot:5515503-Pleurochrysis_carterae.AAC.1